MLSGTELLSGALFSIVLILMSIIDAAFTNLSKVSARRLLDRPRAKAAATLVAWLDTRAEVLTSIHIIIQFLLVSGAVFLYGIFQRRQIPYVGGALATVIVMMLIILVFRHLIPRIIAMRSPETVLLRLFPLFRIAHFTLRPLSRLLMGALNYFHRWEEEMEPAKEE